MRLIRAEEAADHADIRVLNQLAFGGPTEAAIVDRLRSDGLIVVSLVALEGDLAVGHVLFTELPIQTAGGTIAAASLAPLAVHPEWQRRGIGSELVRAGLDSCRKSGVAAVLVLGHPGYYRRFGFTSEAVQFIASPWSHLGEPWMALELIPGALRDLSGTAMYPEAFLS